MMQFYVMYMKFVVFSMKIFMTNKILLMVEFSGFSVDFPQPVVVVVSYLRADATSFQ